ncbi:MAG: lysophospholipase [Coriobacteriales bacterium]|jgi:alpha-beta hydrolase superfamily lysophospholipase|nr:lysophospholipase [Coriobacteriales bacterium]
MKTTNLTYPSQNGHNTIQGWLKEPDKVATGKQLPRAIIQIIHGAAEYSGRYTHVAKFLVEKGFVVCGHDHIGHGLSVTGPEELGHFPAKDGMSILVADVHNLREAIQPRYLQSVPYIMFGHSMGSFILRVYLAQFGNGLSAAVLSGTTQPTQFGAAASAWYAKHTAIRQGEMAFSKRLHDMGLGSYSRKIMKPRTDFDWLSIDDEIVDAYIADPLCGFRFTNGAYAALTTMMREMIARPTLAKTPKDLCILAISGFDDPLSSKGKAPLAVTRAYKTAGVETADARVYSGLRHELFNEPQKRKLMNDMVDWLSRRLGI